MGIDKYSGTVDSRIRAIINSKASTDAKVAIIMQIVRTCEEQAAGKVLLELNQHLWRKERKSDTGSTDSALRMQSEQLDLS